MESMVKLNGYLTDPFKIQAGARQGDKLSPTLFNLYINDLIGEINSLGYGVQYDDVKLSILAYADDLVLISENEEQLQSILDTLHNPQITGT